MAGKGPCPSIVTAPFGADWAPTGHQCDSTAGHAGAHGCGCGYRWTAETVITADGAAEVMAGMGFRPRSGKRGN